MPFSTWRAGRSWRLKRRSSAAAGRDRPSCWRPPTALLQVAPASVVAIERIPTAAVVDQQIEAAADPQRPGPGCDARSSVTVRLDLAGDRCRAPSWYILEQDPGGCRLLSMKATPTGQAHHDAGPGHLELITATVHETRPGPGVAAGELGSAPRPGWE